MRGEIKAPSKLRRIKTIPTNVRTFLRTPALLDFALAIVFVRCDERKGKVGYKFRSELCEVFLPASYFKVVQKQRCFDESASRSTRASHTQHTHYTHARRTTLRTRAHTFSFYSISIFSLSLIHTLSGFTSHRERFFSFSRVYVLHSLSLCRAFLRKPFTPKHARVIVPTRSSLIRMSAWSFLALFLSTCSSSSSD